MKFAFVLFSYYPDVDLARDLLAMTRACQQRNVDVTIFYMKWEGVKPDNIKIKVLPADGVTKTTKRESFVEQMLERTVENFDIVVGFNKMPGLDFYYVTEDCFAVNEYKSRSIFYRMTAEARQRMDFEKAIFGKSQVTISLLISPSQYEDYKSHYKTKKRRLLKLPPGVSKKVFPDAEAKAIRKMLRSEYSVAEQDFLILHASTGKIVHRLERTLIAISKLPDNLKDKVHFFITEAQNSNKYLQLAEHLGIRSNIKIIAATTDTKELFQAADALIYSPNRDDLGAVILESIIAGLPVLVAKNYGHAYHIKQSDASIVCPSPFNQEIFNQELVNMLSKEKIRQWKANGLAYGKENDLYSMHQTVATILVQDASSYQ